MSRSVTIPRSPELSVSNEWKTCSEYLSGFPVGQSFYNTKPRTWYSMTHSYLMRDDRIGKTLTKKPTCHSRTNI